MAIPGRATRREFLRTAGALGATFAWGGAAAAPSRTRWVERRDLFAEGVASGDPVPDSVLLWTCASGGGGAAAVPLTVQVAEDAAFAPAVATARTPAPAAPDPPARAPVGG